MISSFAFKFNLRRYTAAQAASFATPDAMRAAGRKNKRKNNGRSRRETFELFEGVR